MLGFSELSFKLERWDDAFGGYSSLYTSARFDNNKLAALEGMMRSAFRWHNWSEALKAVELVMYESSFGADIKREATYVKAKSLMASSRRAEALSVMETLAQDVHDLYGAEAAYMLVQDCYDRGDFAKAEEKVYAFADAGSGQTYWLAKSFIVLGDSFAERDERMLYLLL